jgi:hypothetical protein
MTAVAGPASIQVQILPDPESSLVTGAGPVRSIQEAELKMPPEQLERFWRPELLERLARAYWVHLRRRSLGLFHVVYGPDFRAVVFGWRKLVLLRFRAPSYEVGEQSGQVTWPIERGLLVAKRGRDRGHLRIAAERRGATVRIRAEVSNFYPWLRGSGMFARLGDFVYTQTQLRLHVRLTRGFLRSLEQANLPELPEGRRAAYPAAG